ncbi:MAG: nitrogen fixation protein, partial [Rhodospirillaceae bacterium]
ARVVRAKVHPIKLPNDEPIAQVIERVRTMLKTNPPPWLRRALKDSEGGDERFIDDED